MAPQLDPLQPLHFIGVGGIGMSALAGILAQRGQAVSGSDRRDNAVVAQLRQCGVQVVLEQTAASLDGLLAASRLRPRVVLSSAVPASNPELARVRELGLEVCHRSDVLADLINSQRSIAVAGTHGKTTTSTLITSLLLATGADPTAVIGGIVPALGSNYRHGQGSLLVAEADESDGTLVKFSPALGVITNLELDHTDHYPNLEALVATMATFAQRCTRLLANGDDPILRHHFQADAWWSIVAPDGADFALVPLEQRGDGSRAVFHEGDQAVGEIHLPLPGRHNLSNAAAALAACRLEGVPFAALAAAIGDLRTPGRRFDCRGIWQERVVVDDYAHHPSEVATTMAMARLMVDSGRSTLPQPPQRLLAVFQPHRFSRTAQFIDGFAAALASADGLVLAPLYSAGEDPIAGISSAELGQRVQALNPGLEVHVAGTMDELADLVAQVSQAGDLVLAMGAGDVNSLWDRLAAGADPRPMAVA
ncbi:MAG: UDP-N-acetylmuramate--L-alanine ligase [Cyanobacteriota bacterium]|nr:UDP-N-acetylmuramate--L-alanine ligase [Cyanobacteriota bacterium]